MFCTGCMKSLIPFDVLQLALQPANDVGGVQVALGQRLQVDGDASAVQRGVGAVRADERGQALDRGIGQDHLRQFLMLLRHGLETKWFRGACEMPWITPVSCTGKNPLGMMM